VNKLRLATSIAVCVCLGHSNADATCLIKNAQDYTADVRAVLDPALDAASASGNEGAAAVIAAAIAGTEAGELVDFVLRNGGIQLSRSIRMIHLT
jgi:hypothetical protein